MKIQPPNLTEPLEGGNLLYDLVQMQQQDEEELRGGIYRNQLLEGFDGSGIEFKNCVFHGCQFSQCCLDNLSLTDVLLENCSFCLPFAGPCRLSGDPARVQADGCRDDSLSASGCVFLGVQSALCSHGRQPVEGGAV